MITKELVDRINFLARKQRDGGLTEKEKNEQKELRELYLKHIRTQVVGALEEAGFRPKKKQKAGCGCNHCKPDIKHEDTCGCGGHHNTPNRTDKLLH